MCLSFHGKRGKLRIHTSVISRFLMDFIDIGHVNIHTEHLSLPELGKLCGKISPFDNHHMLSTLSQILYGIPQERVVVARTSDGDEVLTGSSFLNLVHYILISSEDIMFDSKNASFVLERKNKYCLPVSMLVQPIESTKLSDAIAKLCPDESLEYRDALLMNLSNCNKMFSNFRHPVCFIDCDENISEKFENLFCNRFR